MNKYEALNKYFGYSEYRGNQETVIDSLIDGRNTIAILKTGGGKSVCFQIPALMASGKTLVITPLISLMYDQVRELKERGINAMYINSMQDNQEIVYRSLALNKIIYVSPERLSSERFIKEISKYHISYLIVDEAHTILWHMDFREAFLNIKGFIKAFDYNICIGMFSATANQYTINEMRRAVGIYDFNIITAPFDREELFYKVVKNQNKLTYIMYYLEKHKMSGIIYCQTRKDVMSLYATLKDKYNVTYYHGGLDNETKMINQDRFISSDETVIITTISFGMGINKPNIRFVINYNIPDSIESLAQMAGRCSRDGEYGECIVLYNPADTRVLNFFIRSIDTTNRNAKEINNIKKYKYIQLNSLLKVLNSNMCLHKSMALYFGQKIESCRSMCSKCKN